MWETSIPPQLILISFFSTISNSTMQPTIEKQQAHQNTGNCSNILWERLSTYYPSYSSTNPSVKN